MTSDVEIPSVRLVSLNFPMDLTCTRKFHNIHIHTNLGKETEILQIKEQQKEKKGKNSKIQGERPNQLRL